MSIPPLVQTDAALPYAFTPSRLAVAVSGSRCVGTSGVPAGIHCGAVISGGDFDPYTPLFGGRRAPVKLLASHAI